MVRQLPDARDTTAVAAGRRPRSKAQLASQALRPEKDDARGQPGGCHRRLLRRDPPTRNPGWGAARVPGRFRELWTLHRGLERHPRDARFYRHRGHRYLTLREIDKAEADLARASELIRGTPDTVEPDGEPNAANVPTSTLHFNVWYHLGLARYLKADFAGAARAYRECLLTAKDSADRLVAATDWLYLTLRRQGRTAEAAALLAPITADLEVVENTAYRNRLLLYQGTKTADEVRRSGTTPVDAATYGYGIAAWHLVDGRAAEAKELLEKVAASEQWPAFGVLAAEAELARMR